jgi:putative endonuclease
LSGIFFTWNYEIFLLKVLIPETKTITAMWYVYILICNDGKHYTGCTSDPDRRLAEHLSGNVESTRLKLPVELLCYTAFKSKYTAFYYEKYLKSGSGRAFAKRHFMGTKFEKDSQ